MTTSVPDLATVSNEYRATLGRLAIDEFRALAADSRYAADMDYYVTDVETYVTAVLNVAALLDVERPNWFRELNVDELNMDSMDHCVFGQIYADYARPDGHATGFSYGFARLIQPRFAQPDLQLGVCSVAPRSVWVAEVARRRELAGATVSTGETPS